MAQHSSSAISPAASPAPATALKGSSGPGATVAHACRPKGSRAARGWLEIGFRRGVGAVFGRLLGLPPAGENVPVELTVTEHGVEEHWVRAFGATTWQSVNCQARGLLVERTGPFEIAFNVSAGNERMIFASTHCRLFGCRIPQYLGVSRSSCDRCADRLDYRHSARSPAVRAARAFTRAGCASTVTAALVAFIGLGELGAFDTIVFHELWTELPRTPSARRELGLHAARDGVYAILFGSLGWFQWGGALVWLLVALLAIEIAITLADFLEEDRTRRLPAGERAMHALMGIVYGAFVVLLFPSLAIWLRQPTGFIVTSYGVLSWLTTALALGVLASGVRDLVAARHLGRRPAA